MRKFFAWSIILLALGLGFLFSQTAPILPFGVLNVSTANTATTTAVLSVGQVSQGLLTGTPGGNATYTTPSAAAWCGAFPFLGANGQKGWDFAYDVKNTSPSGQTITVAGGSGVTVQSDGLVPGGSVKHYRVVFRDCQVPAITMVPVGSNLF